MDCSKSFNEHSDRLRSAREEADRDDLHHAMSGVETGRQRKHLPDHDRIDPSTGKKRRTAADILQDTLEWLLLHNPEYRHAHNRAMEVLHRAEHATQTALEKVLAKLRDAQSVLDDILLRAAQLPDGTKVFRDQQGTVQTDDGSIVDTDLAATIEWRGDEPTYEEYSTSKQRIRDLNDAADDLRGVEAELGGIRGELTDNEAPPSQDRIEVLERQIRQLQTRADAHNPDRDLTSASIAQPIETNLPTAAAIPITNLGTNPGNKN